MATSSSTIASVLILAPPSRHSFRPRPSSFPARTLPDTPSPVQLHESLRETLRCKTMICPGYSPCGQKTKCRTRQCCRLQSRVSQPPRQVTRSTRGWPLRGCWRRTQQPALAAFVFSFSPSLLYPFLIISFISSILFLLFPLLFSHVSFPFSDLGSISLHVFLFH